MTTEDDPQKIKARLSDVAADVRDVYQDAVCCINALQAELDDYKQAPGVRAEHYRQKAIKAERERDELADRVDALRDQIGIVTRERDEWEANAENAALRAGQGTHRTERDDNDE